jgi:phenylacetate-CoA ligase
MSFNNPLIKMFERIRGTEIISRTETLLLTDRLKRDEIDRLVDDKKRRLLNHFLSSGNPYSAFACDSKISSGLPSLDRLPILTKRQLRSFYPSVKESVEKDHHRKFNLVRSGGTTGDPVQLFMSYESRSWAGGAMYRYYHWWNIRFRDRIGILWGAQEPADARALSSRWKRLKNSLSNRLVLNTFYIDGPILERHYHTLYKFNPSTLRGYANSLYEFALFMRRNSLPVWRELRVVSSTSEKLTKEMQDVIESTLGAPVTNQYGCGEVNSVAFECPEGRNLHIAEEHVIVEVVDEDGKPVVGKPGKILLTDLDNYLTPVIRYEVGDLGTISGEPCGCGRPHYVLKEITGRLSEALNLGNGRKIAPSYWSVLLRPYLEVEQACVRILNDFHLEIDLVLRRGLSSDVLDYLKTSVSKAVGENVKVVWRKVDRIPNVKSGKKPYVRRIEDEIPACVSVTNL